MRSAVGRGVLVLALSVTLAVGVFGAPPNDRDERSKPNPISRLVKKVLQLFGDGLVVPTP